MLTTDESSTQLWVCYIHTAVYEQTPLPDKPLLCIPVFVLTTDVVIVNLTASPR